MFHSRVTTSTESRAMSSGELALREFFSHHDEALGNAAVLLAEAVTVDDGGILEPVQGHVHRAKTEHRSVEIMAVEHAGLDVETCVRVSPGVGIIATQVFGSVDQEAGCAADRGGQPRRSSSRLARRAHPVYGLPWRARLQDPQDEPAKAFLAPVRESRAPPKRQRECALFSRQLIIG